MRYDLSVYDERQAWRGLGFEVPSKVDRQPATRPEILTSNSFQLVQAGRVVLRAEVSPDWCEVALHHQEPLQSVLEPISFALASKIGSADEAQWWGRWAHEICDGLLSSPSSPIHAGRWMLRPIGPSRNGPGQLAVTLPSYDCDQVSQIAEIDGTINWFSMDADLVPLRQLSAVDGSRVKAWRKHVQTGTLPPVLAWWVAGLHSWVVLDGHDRLRAALTHDRFPPVLALHELQRLEDARARSSFTDLDEHDRLNRVIEVQPDHHRAHDALARAVTAASVGFEEASRTTAWFAPPQPI